MYMYKVAMQNRIHDSVIDLAVQCTCVEYVDHIREWRTVCAEILGPEIGTGWGTVEVRTMTTALVKAMYCAELCLWRANTIS